eukprot:2222319-Prymnesium_polylepis.1
MSHKIYDANTFDATATLIVAPVIFFAGPVVLCTLLPSPFGPAAACVLVALAVLPRLLWRSSQPAEGR